MEKHIIFLFCAALLSAVTQILAKSYRKDYSYDWRTDAFYKLHVDSGSMPRREVCTFEGAKLMSPMSAQELSQVHARKNQFPHTEEDGAWQQHESSDGQSIINYSEARDVLEMSCQLTTRDGNVITRSVFQDMPFFICKVEAKDVRYNSQCRVHVEGYRYFPSVGSCYKISPVAYKWHKAAAECQAEGAYLAVINSEQEADVLRTISSPVKDVPYSSDNINLFHIGIRAVKNSEPKVFETIFNESLEKAGFNIWAPGEPNNVEGREHCGSLSGTLGKLNDERCYLARSFICEKEVVYQGH